MPDNEMKMNFAVIVQYANAIILIQLLHFVKSMYPYFSGIMLLVVIKKKKKVLSEHF